MDKIIFLKGITKKGKQRVKQWGDEWFILKSAASVLFSDKKGPWFFIQAATDITETGGSTRWINAHMDENFVVTFQNNTEI